jgi:hypothetical protein
MIADESVTTGAGSAKEASHSLRKRLRESGPWHAAALAGVLALAPANARNRSSISLYQRMVFGEWFRPSWCWRYSSMTAESLMSFFFMLFQVTFLLGCLLGCAAIFTSPFG